MSDDEGKRTIEQAKIDIEIWSIHLHLLELSMTIILIGTALLYEVTKPRGQTGLIISIVWLATGGIFALYVICHWKGMKK